MEEKPNTTAQKTTYAVILTGFGDHKIQVIKVVRELTGIGLAEAKILVEGVPSPLKEGVSRKEASNVKRMIEGAGGTVKVHQRI